MLLDYRENVGGGKFCGVATKLLDPYIPVGMFIVAAWEGCISIAKNMQSMPVFVASIEQLKHYVRHLQPA